MTQYTEAPLTATLKSGKEYDAAWLVLRADSPVEMQSMLDALTTNGFGAVLGRADQAFKAEFNTGKGLGATPIAAPQNPTAQAPAPQQEPNPWAASTPAQAQPQQDPWGGYGQQAQAPAPQAAPPQQAGNFDSDAGAPLVLGMPARKVSKVSAKTGKPWAAWADPRPKEATQHIQERTDDPNHPGLAAGTHTFWQFIR